MLHRARVLADLFDAHHVRANCVRDDHVPQATLVYPRHQRRPLPGCPRPHLSRTRYKAAWKGIVGNLAIRVCNICAQAVSIGTVRAQRKVDRWG